MLSVGIMNKSTFTKQVKTITQSMQIMIIKLINMLEEPFLVSNIK